MHPRPRRGTLTWPILSVGGAGKFTNRPSGSRPTLKKANQVDYETGIEQRFFGQDEGDSLETLGLARNLRLMVSKSARMERLTC